MSWQDGTLTKKDYFVEYKFIIENKPLTTALTSFPEPLRHVRIDKCPDIRLLQLLCLV